jgi:hypothetical protein
MVAHSSRLLLKKVGSSRRWLLCTPMTGQEECQLTVLHRNLKSSVHPKAKNGFPIKVFPQGTF